MHFFLVPRGTRTGTKSQFKRVRAPENEKFSHAFKAFSLYPTKLQDASLHVLFARHKLVVSSLSLQGLHSVKLHVTKVENLLLKP